MSKIVAIHGIGQQLRGRHTLARAWLDAARDGLGEASGIVLDESDFRMVAYGPLFRPPGERGGDDIDPATLAPMEIELLDAFWREAARLSAQGGNSDADESPIIQGPGETGRARVPSFVQEALRQLGNSRFFNALNGPPAVLKVVRQAHLFLHDQAIKQAVLARFDEAIADDTRIVIAHSLGSVIAYEALWRKPHGPVKALLTLGSPLGIAPMICGDLSPAPGAGGGVPPGIERWVNVADRGDIVALEKRLAPRFGAVEDQFVHNGWHAHDACNYLSAQETGLALASMLREFA